MLLLRVVISRALINWHLVSAPAVAAAEEGNHQRIRVDQAMMLMHDFQYPRRGMTISILDSVRTFLSVCLSVCVSALQSVCLCHCLCFSTTACIIVSWRACAYPPDKAGMAVERIKQHYYF